MSKLKSKIDQLFAVSAANKKPVAETLERGLTLKVNWTETQARKLIAARKGVEPSEKEIQILLGCLGFQHHVISTPGITPSGFHYIEILEVLPTPEPTPEQPPEAPAVSESVAFRLDRDTCIQAILKAVGERDNFWTSTNSMDLLGKGLRDMTDQELALQYRKDVLRDFTGPTVLADRLWENLPSLDQTLAEQEGRLLPDGKAS